VQDFEGLVQKWKQQWEDAEKEKLLLEAKVNLLIDRMREGRIATVDEGKLMKELKDSEMKVKKQASKIKDMKSEIQALRAGREKAMHSLNSMDANLSNLVRSSINGAFDSIANSSS
jgi:SMC interacting uncharacterized protein involved in chromosome segregation